MKQEQNQKGEILLCCNGGEKEFVSLIFKDTNFWLTQKAISEQFGCSIDNISLHLKNIAELMAEDERLMSMQKTGRFLTGEQRNVLEGKGSVSHKAAVSSIYDEFGKRQDTAYISEYDRQAANDLKGETDD